MKPVAVFQLELEYAPLLNEFRKWHWSKEHRVKGYIVTKILAQIGRRKEPLSGRPKLWAIRYSAGRPRSKARGGFIGPDQDSSGSKLWLDALVRLGWLRDDAPDCIELVSEWCKARRGEGRVVVHLFDGEQANAQYEENQGW